MNLNELIPAHQMKCEEWLFKPTVTCMAESHVCSHMYAVYLTFLVSFNVAAAAADINTETDKEWEVNGPL